MISCFADDVFTWIDSEGNKHYSNSSNNQNSEKADLPKIEKQDIEERIEELKSVSNKTCINKGGINCEAKADTDGSVICMDGSKDSIENFRDMCSEVKLSTEIYMPNKRSNKMLVRYPIVVKVRNNAAIEARNVKIELNVLKSLSSELREKLQLEGPSNIPQFGIAEYTFTGRSYDERILKKANINSYCDNCWNPALPITPIK